MTPIQARDERTMPHSINEVWQVLGDVQNYPRWWPRSVGLSVLEARSEIIGSTFQLRPMGGRAFRCRIESLEQPNRICMEYFGGFITGRGEWQLEAIDSSTKVCYELDVQAAGVLVACLARFFPLARFHSMQMQTVLKRLQDETQRRKTAS